MLEFKTKHGKVSGLGDSYEQSSDKTYYQIHRDKETLHHNFGDMCKSGENCVNFGWSTSEGLFLSCNFSYSDSGIHVWFEATSGRLVVTMTPEHTHYDSYPLPEEEIEPTPPDAEPVMGKFITNLFLNKKCEIPF
jgi:hypothetical protein